MLRILPIVLGVLVVSGCAVASDDPMSTPEPVVTVEPSETVAPAPFGLGELFEEWDAGFAASDEVGLFLVVLDLPNAVEGECYPALEAAQREDLSAQAANASAEVDRVTAETGGVRAIDIYSAWMGYVGTARFLCDV